MRRVIYVRFMPIRAYTYVPQRGMVVWEGIAGTCVRYTRPIYAPGTRTSLT